MNTVVVMVSEFPTKLTSSCFGIFVVNLRPNVVSGQSGVLNTFIVIWGITENYHYSGNRNFVVFLHEKNVMKNTGKSYGPRCRQQHNIARDPAYYSRALRAT